MSASTNWEDVYRVQTARIADLERENAALKATLAAVFEANERGRKAWQEAHPNKEMVWPDQAKLVEWLLSENAELRAHAERVGDANDQMVVENAALRKDQERLDWLIKLEEDDRIKFCRGWYRWTPDDVRAEIDAAREEAQP